MEKAKEQDFRFWLGNEVKRAEEKETVQKNRMKRKSIRDTFYPKPVLLVLFKQTADCINICLIWVIQPKKRKEKKKQIKAISPPYCLMPFICTIDAAAFPAHFFSSLSLLSVFTMFPLLVSYSPSLSLPFALRKGDEASHIPLLLLPQITACRPGWTHKRESKLHNHKGV